MAQMSRAASEHKSKTSHAHFIQPADLEQTPSPPLSSARDEKHPPRLASKVSPGVDGNHDVNIKHEHQWLADFLLSLKKERPSSWVNDDASNRPETAKCKLERFLSRIPACEAMRMETMFKSTMQFTSATMGTLEADYTQVAINSMLLRLAEEEEGVARTRKEAQEQARNKGLTLRVRCRYAVKYQTQASSMVAW